MSILPNSVNVQRELDFIEAINALVKKYKVTNIDGTELLPFHIRENSERICYLKLLLIQNPSLYLQGEELELLARKLLGKPILDLLDNIQIKIYLAKAAYLQDNVFFSFQGCLSLLQEISSADAVFLNPKIADTLWSLVHDLSCNRSLERSNQCQLVTLALSVADRDQALFLLPTLRAIEFELGSTELKSISYYEELDYGTNELLHSFYQSVADFNGNSPIDRFDVAPLIRMISHSNVAENLRILKLIMERDSHASICIFLSMGLRSDECKTFFLEISLVRFPGAIYMVLCKTLLLLDQSCDISQFIENPSDQLLLQVLSLVENYGPDTSPDYLEARSFAEIANELSGKEKMLMIADLREPLYLLPFVDSDRVDKDRGYRIEMIRDLARSTNLKSFDSAILLAQADNVESIEIAMTKVEWLFLQKELSYDMLALELKYLENYITDNATAVFKMLRSIRNQIIEKDKMMLTLPLYFETLVKLDRVDNILVRL